jgi:hypothetical protein
MHPSNQPRAVRLGKFVFVAAHIVAWMRDDNRTRIWTTDSSCATDGDASYLIDGLEAAAQLDAFFDLKPVAVPRRRES